MYSIKDVAKLAGVSISTVSNVLNNSKFVSEDLTARVHLAVEQLGYEANPIAKKMKTKRTGTIGIITADMCGLFYPYVIKGIYEVLSDKGYDVLIADTNSVNDRLGGFEREKENIRSMLANRVDGIIFASTVPEDMRSSYLEEVQKLARKYKHIPLVSIERDFSAFGIDSVFSDSFNAARTATGHLISIGCKKIVHITGQIYTSESQDRLKGYIQALNDNGLYFDRNTMVSYGDYTHQSGYLAMKKLIDSSPDMDGVFAGNDQMAVGALKALNENKYEVPDNVKIIGYDNVFVTSIVKPSLSSINVKKKSLGKEAAGILLKRIQETEPISKTLAVKLETNLIVRGSTVKNAHEDWILSDW